MFIHFPSQFIAVWKVLTQFLTHPYWAWQSNVGWTRPYGNQYERIQIPLTPKWDSSLVLRKQQVVVTLGRNHFLIYGSAWISMDLFKAEIIHGYPRFRTLPRSATMCKTIHWCFTQNGDRLILLNNSSYFLLFRWLGGSYLTSPPSAHLKSQLFCAAIDLHSAREENFGARHDGRGLRHLAMTDMTDMTPVQNGLVFSWETKRLKHGSVSKPIVPLVNIKIAGKWMFIPLKMVLIGIDPYPHVETTIFLPLKYTSTT